MDEKATAMQDGMAVAQVYFPLSCGCSLANDDTKGSGIGFVRCRHGRTIFAPFLEGVQKDSWEIKEMRTHLL